jgi:hypothetical protein
VIALSGLERTLADLGREARAHHRRWYWYLTERERVGSAIRAAYSREAMVETAIRVVGPRLDGPAARDAVAWLRSPLSRRVLAAEEEAESPARRDAAEALVAGLPAAPADPARLARLGRLGRAIRLTYLRLATEEAMREGLEQATWAFLTPAGRRWAERDAPGVDGRLAAVEAAAFDTMTMLLTTYRPLSDAELDELGRVSESPAGAWLADAFRDVLAAAVPAASQRAADLLHADRRRR